MKWQATPLAKNHMFDLILRKQTQLLPWVLNDLHTASQTMNPPVTNIVQIKQSKAFPCSSSTYVLRLLMSQYSVIAEDKLIIFALYLIHTHRQFEALLTSDNDINEMIKIMTRVWVDVWVDTKILMCSESWSCRWISQCYL